MTRRGLDIINAAADLLGLPRVETLTDASEDTRKLLELLVRICRLLGDQHNWAFLRGESEITTVAQITTGTAAVTNGAAGVVFTGVTLTPSVVGRAISFAGHPITYRIAAFTSSTTVTLNRAYLGDTNTSTTYTIVQDRYDLAADFSRPLGEWASFFGPFPLQPVDPDEFMQIRQTSAGMTTGEPQVFTIYGVNENTTAQTIWLHPYPIEQRLFPYAYHRVHPDIVRDADRVLFPVTKDEIIITALVEVWQRNLNDDTRADGFLGDFLRKQNSILVTDSDKTRRRPRFTMDNGQLAAEFGKWNRRRGVDWGSAFDLVGFHGIRR